MPTELRRIVFSNADLYAALDLYLCRSGDGLPCGTITRVRGDSYGVVRFDINTTKGTVDTMQLAAEQVGGALISYCIVSHIPMPRGFVKSMVISGDNVALEMTDSAGKALGTSEKSTHLAADPPIFR
jgi:hypothetical protein